ncbi:MAG: hypothetical protein CVU56_11035 [Deltaproteobacteria bacterium HGW-Deltaproteobacteria-14]|jgi:hypothetical protein|nr:MAG: hypothetical protein CVU56_11035 [Deltaproteobacteria bacterium HGW-Deltaproteobacteria-14]
MLRIATLAALVLVTLTACGDSADPASTAAPPDTFVGVDTAAPAEDVTRPVDTSPSPDSLEPPDSLGTADTSPPLDTVSPTPDPCGGVPAAGRCDGNTLSVCVSGTGSGEPFAISVPCGAGYACTATASGASCVPNLACVPGASECHNGAVARCVAGAWQETPCPSGCNATPIGALCPPAVPTTHYANTVEYEYRAYNAGFTDWGADVYAAPARRFMVLSYANGELLDVTTSDDDGAFDLDVVPAALEDGDDFVALAAIAATSGADVDYAIVSPGGSLGQRSVEALALSGAPDPKVWVWSWRTTDIPAAAGVYLPLASGSGAAYAFNYLSAVHDFGVSLFGARAGTSLAVWLDYGVSWDCGNCFLDFPAHAAGLDFGSQMFIRADADESFWSGAVLAHELGHWLMATYGVAPGEGGEHVLGVPTHPGIAWSEGFATWFSSIVRQQSFYYDKQNGLFFWVDLDTRAYSTGVPWLRPLSEYGLEQLIDENEVARMLLGVTTDANVVALIDAVASPRMTVAPFLRGYLRRTWDALDGDGFPLPAWSTDQSAPHLADFLDALQCEDLVTASQVDAQTEPWAHYPYPSSAPLCLGGELPIQVTWRATATATLAEVRWYVPLAEELVLAFDPPSGPPTVIPAGSAPGTATLAFTAPRRPATIAGAAPRLVGLDVSGAGAGWRVAGRVPYDAPALPAPALDGPRVNLRGALGGPSIRLTAVPAAARAPRTSNRPMIPR